MKLLAVMVPVWAWGMVSCDDQDAIEARVRASVQDPSAIVHCQEPRAWHGEKEWLCTSDLRGQRRCYKLEDRNNSPTEWTCPSTQTHVPSWQPE